MSLVLMQVFPILSEILNLVDQAYKAVIGVLWSALVTYGLAPKYAFLTQFTSYTPYQNLEGALFVGAYFQFTIIAIIIATLVALFLNSFIRPQTTQLFVIRVAVAVILGSVSFILSVWAFSVLGGMYSILYNNSGISWSNFLLFSSHNYAPVAGNTAGGDYSILIEAFTLTGYFTSVISLFSILMIRQALLLFSLTILPFATILMVFNRASRFTERVWEIIIEMAAYPFFVLLCLYLGHIFSWDVPLQLAFLFLPSILPGYLFVSGRSFLSAPVLGFLGGMTMAGTVGRGLEAAGIVSGVMKGGATMNTLKDAALLPFRENRSSHLYAAGEGKPGAIPWKELVNEELRSRKK